MLFSGRMIEVPSTVMSLEAFLPPLIQGVDPLAGITPGTSVASPNGLRPFSGRSSMRLLSMTVDTLEAAVDNWVKAALTSTAVLTSPSLSAISRATVCRTSTRTSVATCF